MVLRQLQIIVLLISIFSKRSAGIPSPQGNFSSENVEKQPLTITAIDQNELMNVDKSKGEGSEHHWDCQEKSDFIQNQISLTTKLLRDGDEFSKKQKDLSADETVLVLGEAGSGKTSLVQFLTGNSKLLSKLVQKETGEYIIEDGIKIGTSATESYTLYPELVTYNSTINFCDSPGFHDSRSSAHEIVSMDIMKSITNGFKNVKILLVENHSSLQYGVSKNSFINLLRHVNNFIVDIDKYRDNIALIATKVPFTYIMTDDINISHPQIVPDEMIVESIVQYINYTESSLTKKLSENISENEKEFYNKVIKLLSSIKTKDENGKPTRINVFHRPYKTGQLKDMSLLEKNRKSLLNTVSNLNSAEVEDNDFDYTLSDTAKMYLECLLRLTSDNYKSKINKISFKLEEYISQKTQNYSSFHEVTSDLSVFTKALHNLSENLDETKNYNEFFEKIHYFISSEKIPLQYNYNERVSILEKYEEMLLKFVDTSSIFIPSSWSVTIKQVLKSVENELHWYQGLCKLINDLASYETQMHKAKIYEEIQDSSTTSNFFNIFRGSKRFNLEQYMDAEADVRKKSEIELILSSILQKSNITCDYDGKLIVKGSHLRLSEINLEHLVRLYCNDAALKEVALLAVDTIYLDVDLDATFNGVNLFIAAPNWKIIGQRRIVLSGPPGKEISSDPYLDNGKDGKPGLPGGNGGAFFGVGLHFTNGENLVIVTNGGQGGPGARGKKGDNGKNGRNGAQILSDMRDAFGLVKTSSMTPVHTLRKGLLSKNLTNDHLFISSNDHEEKFVLYTIDGSGCYYFDERFCRYNVTAEIDWYEEEGECGRSGSLGGSGGEGGIGGFAGKQTLIELFESSLILSESNNGSRGSCGDMGSFGDSGSDGVGIACFNIRRNDHKSVPKSYWKCFNTTTASTCTDQISQHFTPLCQKSAEIKQPAPTKFTDYAYYLLDYAVLLEAHSSNAVFNNIITDFKRSLKNKFSFNLNEMGLLLFKKV